MGIRHVHSMLPIYFHYLLFQGERGEFGLDGLDGLTGIVGRRGSKGRIEWQIGNLSRGRRLQEIMSPIMITPPIVSTIKREQQCTA